MPKTRIFISSVNEEELKPLRANLYDVLTELGHEPVMWERNFGPWDTTMDSVMRCLQAVESSDIYLLFIRYRSGTFYAEADRTITHLEFIKAADAEKTIIVFVDRGVKTIFFRKVQAFLHHFIEHFQEENGRSPSAKVIMEAIKQHDDIPKEVDPYVWFLLYDMIRRQVYMDDLSLGVPIDWKLYLSDLLRRGTMLLPLQDSIAKNSVRLEQYDDAYEVLTHIFPHFQPTSLREPAVFLEKIMNGFSGSVIAKQYGEFMSEKVGTYQDCSAATLYKREDMKMIFVGKFGDATCEPCYPLEDRNSYVALTYKAGDRSEQIYYKESKQRFYYGIRSGAYVLTLHFPADANWSNEKNMLYQDCVESAIMSNNPLLKQFIQLLVGGISS